MTLLSDTNDDNLHFSDNILSGNDVVRALIKDRNGELLAGNLYYHSMAIDSKKISNPQLEIAKIADAFPEVDIKALEKNFVTGKRFIPLKKKMTPKEYSKALKLGIPGSLFTKEIYRFYPNGPLASHVIGYLDFENKGVMGIEKEFDVLLRKGGDFFLSLDIRLQAILRRELLATITEKEAAGGVGILLNISNCEIEAMVSLPDFDPNLKKDENFFNRATMGLYEMGSVFKIFSLAAALDSGAVKEFDEILVDSPLKISGRSISDYSPKSGRLPMREAFIKSSNVAFARVALMTDVKLPYYYNRFGFYEKVSVELPGFAKPILPKESEWTDLTLATASYGHGISVTPMHVAVALAEIVNGGQKCSPTILLKKHQDVIESNTENIVSTDTSETLTRLMREVVLYGTGRRAGSFEVEVAGKTGSADKAINGIYSKEKTLASFAGFFPAKNPIYVFFVAIDEPKNMGRGTTTGGAVAAPLAGRVANQIMRLPFVDNRQ